MGTFAIALAVASLFPQGAAEVPLRPDAGPDRTVVAGEPVRLEGRLDGRAPLEWWVSDGNGPTEDMVVRHHSVHGVTAFGPLRDKDGLVYHSPMDFELIRGKLFGCDVNRERFYFADTETGVVTPVGPVTEHSVQGLAYDRVHGRLFGLEMKGDLYQINYATGSMHPIGRLAIPGSKPHFFALAYEARTGQLYSVDQKGHRLVRIEPGTARLEVVGPMGDEVQWVDELTFHGGVLYASISVIVDGHMDHAKLMRVNQGTAEMEQVGPIIEGVSPHAMLVVSVPEPAEWTVASAPEEVRFSDRKALEALVTFGTPGRYELVLNTLDRRGPLTDSVVFEVLPQAGVEE